MNWDLFWAGGVAAFAGFDYWRSRRDVATGTNSTFSDWLRRRFRTDTKTGKVAFSLVLCGFGLTFWHHITQGHWL